MRQCAKHVSAGGRAHPREHGTEQTTALCKNWHMNAARSAVPARTLVMLLALNLLVWVWATRVVCAVPVLPLQFKATPVAIQVTAVQPGMARPIDPSRIGAVSAV